MSRSFISRRFMFLRGLISTSIGKKLSLVRYGHKKEGRFICSEKKPWITVNYNRTPEDFVLYSLFNVHTVCTQTHT